MKIRFPFQVKLNDGYHAANEIIEVEDATEYVKEGAEVIEESKPVAEENGIVKTRRSRKKS